MAQVPSNLIPIRVTQLDDAPVASEDGLLLYVYNGNTYKIRAGDLLQVSGVPVSRQVIAGTGLQGGGQLSSNVTLSVAPNGIGYSQLAATGVSPGTYGDGGNMPVVTVDDKGRVTAASTVPVTVSGYVPTTREIIAGDGLTGGGFLNTNVTLSANLSNSTPNSVETSGSAGVSTEISRSDHKHPAIDLSDDNQVDNILGLDNGGTGNSLAVAPGAVAYSGVDAMYFTAAGVTGQIFKSNGTGVPTWVNQNTIAAGSANTLLGGAANQILYQSATDVTGFVSSPVAADTFLKWNGSSFVWSAVAGAGTVTSVGTGTGLSGGPITSAGTINFSNAGVGTWAATPSSANLAAAMTDETGSGALVFGTAPTLSAPTIDGANPYIQFSNGSAVALAAGRMWYDGSTGSWNLGMGGGNITQQVGEELFIYGKASAAITDSPLQLVYQTGTVGASGVITFGPTVPGITNGNMIVGVATESLALNAFGRVTSFGVVHGVTTDGTAYGEVWADNDLIWYNPVTGNPTNVKPVAPNIKVSVGIVIKAGNGGSGSFQVEINHGSVLGGTDSNVELTSVASNNLLQYYAAGGYWRNVAPASVTGVGSLANSLTIGTGLSGTSYNGSSAVTVAIDSTVATLTGTQTLTNKTISGSSNTLSNIANSSLTNSSITLGTTTTSLGATSLTLDGLTSVTVTQDPVSALQLTTKQYVDGVAQGLNVKSAVLWSTTANILLTGLTTQAGGEWTGTLTAGDRILVKNQTLPAENGIYAASAVGWTRTTDADTWNELVSAFTFIEQGSTLADTGWTCTVNPGGTLGVTAVTWTQFSGAGTYTAGTGLTLTGTQFSLTSPVTAVTGGTGQTTFATGDILYASATNTLSKLAVGTAGQVLKVNGSGVPTWSGVYGGSF